LAHHTTDAGAVTLEQWTLVEQTLGNTVTASVATLEYDDMTDLFTAMAAGFQPDPDFTP
jgi:hypothetical protein